MIVRVEIMPWTEARERARRIREEVFVREQGVPVELELDEWDERCEHALAFDADNNPVGTGRLLPDGHIGRMAVLRDWRGRGVGAALLHALVERARERGMREAMLNAQTHATAFYRRAGFVEEGEPFVEAGIAHVAMRRGLS